MQPQEYQKMFVLEDFYWWFVARRRAIMLLLRKFMANSPPSADTLALDVGCGTGSITNYLSNFYKVIGLDASLEALRLCLQRRGSYRLVQGSAYRLPFLDNSFGLVTALDLLEHLEDDMAAVQEFNRVLKHGGLIVVSVPAYNFLWSAHDEALGHKRRYTARQLYRIVRKAGFKLKKLSYLISVLFLPIALFKIFQNLFYRRHHGGDNLKTALIILPPLINWGLIVSLLIEAYLLLYFSFPVGASIVCVAIKK